MPPGVSLGEKVSGGTMGTLAAAFITTVLGKADS